MASMHIVDERGRVHSAGDALIILMAMNPKTRWLARVARVVPPVRAGIRRKYRTIADSRSERSEKVPDVEPTVVRPRWTRLPDEG